MNAMAAVKRAADAIHFFRQDCISGRPDVGYGLGRTGPELTCGHADVCNK
jgi:hypothetical protein